MKTIQYGIDTDTGLVWSRFGDKIAVPILDYSPSYLYNTGSHLEAFNVFDALQNRVIHWTRKISKEIKNKHRQFWGLKPLK